MTIRMLINAMAPNELRIAIVEDGELTELDIEASDTSTLKGNVYKGVIHNVEGSLEAAFVDIGRHKQGFLPFSEVSPSQYNRPWNGKGKPKITDVLKRGQEIVVQVAKDAIGEKGATLTTYLSLPGRYTVLMPESDANGISRKIDDDKVRKRIKTIAQKMNRPDGCGFIVRTAGLGQTRLALQKDLDKVIEQWQKLEKAAKIARAPSIIHSEPDLIGRTLRDFFSEEIDEVLIDSKDEYEAARDYFEEVMPAYLERLHHYQNPIPIFAYHHVEEQIESTFERQVKLPSGGSIVIDETEALVAIDVNSGRMTSEGDHERTVFKTNCEAAEEAARQLKLRDLGGIVVIDFIDMEESKNKREVERLLGEAAKEDKARYKISRINSKGLCVLTRQRIRQGMRKAFQYRCPVCTGTGWLRTGESHSLSLLRRVEARLAQGGVGEVRVKTHKETADYLLNNKRSELLALERNFNCRIIVTARAEMDRGKDEVTYLSNKEVLEEITERLPPREERRRGGKRKRRTKRAAEIPVEPDDDDVDDGDDDEDARSKRRRRRRRGRPEEGARPEAVAARGNSKAPQPAKAAGTEEPEVPPLEPKGSTTFTGRLSPEQIERAKAERRARKARRDGDHATADRILAALDPADKAASLPKSRPAPSKPRPAPSKPSPAPSKPSPAPSKPSPESEDGMDVMHALAVAEAVLNAHGDEVDDDAVFEAAGIRPESKGLESPSVDGRGPSSDGAATEAEANADEDESADSSKAGGGDSEPGSDGDAERSGKRRRRRRRGRRRRSNGEDEGTNGQQSANEGAQQSVNGSEESPAGNEEKPKKNEEKQKGNREKPKEKQENPHGDMEQAAEAPAGHEAAVSAEGAVALTWQEPAEEVSAARKALLLRIFGAR